MDINNKNKRGLILTEGKNSKASKPCNETIEFGDL